MRHNKTDIIINDEDSMHDFAKEMAKNATAGQIYYLHGTLGAGKSTFSRHFIRSLCGDDIEVPSPTFTLVQTYDTPKNSIWHFDLYRLQDAEEIYEIGWEEALERQAIMLIEWPDRLDYLRPSHGIDIHIDILDNNQRKITVTP